MTLLSRKSNQWNWTEFHKWKDRERAPKIKSFPLIHPKTKVFTMGSCFAQNVARFLVQKGIHAESFPETTHFDPAIIAQDLHQLLDRPHYQDSDFLQSHDGLWANPFRKPSHRESTIEGLRLWSENINALAAQRLKDSDVVVLTMGGTETWRHPVTQKTYLTIPYPDLFNHQSDPSDPLKKNLIAEVHNLSFQEVYDSLDLSVQLIKRTYPEKSILMTVSPNRHTFVVTDRDVRLATCQSKATLRAAVGEIVQKYQNQGVHYFHAFEIFEYNEHPKVYFDEQLRHVREFGVSHVMNEFMKYFVSEDLHNEAERELLSKIGKSGDLGLYLPQKQNIGKRFRKIIVRGLQRVNQYKWADRVLKSN